MDFGVCKKHIPNSITCCNLVSGCIAITFAIKGDLPLALLFIILGAVFDFFDGMVARLLGVSSPIGKELDSLADVVTFGVAPSAIIFYELQVVEYPYILNGTLLASIIPYMAFLVAAFSALRLAKFNLDTRQTTSFIGLPTPANALCWGSLIVGFGEYLEQFTWFLPALMVGILLSSWILIAEIPMFALKFKHWGYNGNEMKYGFVLFSAAALIASIIFGIVSGNYNICYSGFSLIIVVYVLLSIIADTKAHS
jgi:CDP-diacylglycerol--serine O-phosphatidyltransferase